MKAKGWLERVSAPETEDPRRKYYGLTDAGRRVIGDEAARLAVLVGYARTKDLLPGTR
jgi:DNA-binding PadR family transcriptional regulator